jgi:macrodomain Ter protein organizer (MatP/YcbG family)
MSTYTMSRANAASLVSRIVDTLAGEGSTVSVELDTQGGDVNVWIDGHLSATLRGTP